LIVYRKEYKYLVPNELLGPIRNVLKPFIDLDDFAMQRDKKEYTVRSIYYDTRLLDFYLEKIEGYKIRKKIRIRGYNKLLGEKVVFLEIKRRYESFNSKNRSPVLYGDLEELFATGNIEDLVLSNKITNKRTIDGKRFFYNVISNSLIPTALVVYEREAFFSKLDKSIRITFDKNLRSMAFPILKDLYREDALVPTLPNDFILELKFNLGFPEWLQEIVSCFHLHRIAISKYTTCLDIQKRYDPVFNPNKYIYRNSAFIN
jgi:VTC domain